MNINTHTKRWYIGRACSSILLLSGLSSLGHAQNILQESGGLVIIEAENTISDLGKWDVSTDLKGFTDSGYIIFTGNQPAGGDPDSPLEYHFKVNQGGLYALHVHCAKETLTLNGVTRTDVANDCYIRVEGDYTAGNNVGNTHGDNAPLADLKRDTKYFGGSNLSFSWTTGNRLDLGGHQNKRIPIYNFKSGETYKFVVSGRSQKFRIDRFVFRRSNVGNNAAQNTNRVESAGLPLNPNLVRLPIPNGRIAFSFDGNDHDHDDEGALPMAAGLAWAAGVSNRFVHLDHSNHIGDNEAEQEAAMIESAAGITSRFGIANRRIFNDQRELDAAIDNFVAEALKSTAADPLWYFCGGPMEVPYRKLEAVATADSSKLQFIRCVSHADFNENHTHGHTHTWDDMQKDFSAVTYYDLPNLNNTNGNRDWNTPLAQWKWLQESDYEPYRWLYSRNYFTNKFDPSDAGMLYWWLSGGPDGGNELAGWPEAQLLLEGAISDVSVGIQGSWRFDEESGTTLVDSSGNGFDGELSNASRVTGVVGGALDFNGSNSTVSIPAAAFAGITNEVTFACWINGATTQPRSDVLLSAVNSDNHRVLNIHLPWKNSLIYWDAGNSGSSYDRFTYKAPTDTFKNQWNHWAFTKNATTGMMKIYLNGNLVASDGGNTRPMGGIEAASIGSAMGNFSYDGQVDQVVLYNNELSAQEVLELYQNQNDLGQLYFTAGFNSESHPNNDFKVRDLNTKVGYIENNTWVSYSAFNFGTGASSIDISAASARNGGTIEVRVGSPTGQLISSVSIPSTGSWNIFNNYTGTIANSPTGTHDLYFIFKGGSGFLLDIETFKIDQ